jgi:hypothetical protein
MINEEANKPEEPDMPKIPKKRVYRRKNAGKKEIMPKVERTEEEEDLAARAKFCSKIRNILDVDYRDTTIAKSLEEDDEYISGQWKQIGRIVMPFVAGGVALEGPQSTVKNAFVIGYYLGSLKSKHNKEVENFNRKFGVIAE